MEKFSMSSLVLVLFLIGGVTSQFTFDHPYPIHDSPFKLFKDASYGQYNPRNTFYPSYGKTFYDYQPYNMPKGYSTWSNYINNYNPIPGFGYSPVSHPFPMFNFPTSFPRLPPFNSKPFGFGAKTFASKTSFVPTSFVGRKSSDFPSSNQNHASHSAIPRSIPTPDDVVSSVKPVVPTLPSFGKSFLRNMGFLYDRPSAASINIPTVEPLLNSAAGNNNGVRSNFNSAFDSFGFNNMAAFPTLSPGHNDGKNFDISYSKESTMNMDFSDGKGHMVTHDSSTMNDNGNVKHSESPEHHYYFNTDNNKMFSSIFGH